MLPVVLGQIEMLVPHALMVIILHVSLRVMNVTVIVRKVHLRLLKKCHMVIIMLGNILKSEVESSIKLIIILKINLWSLNFLAR